MFTTRSSSRYSSPSMKIMMKFNSKVFKNPRFKKIKGENDVGKVTVLSSKTLQFFTKGLNIITVRVPHTELTHLELTFKGVRYIGNPHYFGHYNEGSHEHQVFIPLSELFLKVIAKETDPKLKGTTKIWCEVERLRDPNQRCFNFFVSSDESMDYQPINPVPPHGIYKSRVLFHKEQPDTPLLK